MDRSEGESNFIFDNPGLKNILPNGVAYKNGYPEFPPVSLQEVRLPGLISTKRTDSFRAANKMLAEGLGVKEEGVARFLKERNTLGMKLRLCVLCNWFLHLSILVKQGLWISVSSMVTLVVLLKKLC